MPPIELKSKRLLLVEGKDDEELFRHVWGFLELDYKDIFIHRYNGKDKLRVGLNTVSRLPGFRDVEVLGVVRDANHNPDGAFQSVRDTLGSFFDNPPAKPLEFSSSTFQNDSSFDGQRISTSILILPGSSKSGELEDLLLAAIDDAETMACVNEYIHCLEANGVSLQKPAKTKLQTFLASRERAEDGLWKALAKDHIRADSESFTEVRNFLSEMAKL